MKHTLTCLVALVPLVAAAPHPARAQVEITPAMGIYWPVGLLVDGDIANGGEERRQVAAGLVGVRMGVWPGRRLGLEGGIAFSPSQVAVTRSTGTEDVTGGVLLMHARAVASLSPPAAPWAFHLGAGVGLVHRSGSAWQTTLGGTAPALALGFGARSRMRRSNLALRLELEDYILFNQFDQGLPNTTGARIHHDFVWSMGLTVPIQ